ncbi:MAG: GspH/FimT family pseudopilin [Methylococcaceae bacterium]|nr:GspH/FimT family pseudopilin [Methylococcaceae bacterium]
MKKYPSLTIGFTLIELLVTIAIASVIMGIAIPSFSTAIQNNRMTSQLNEFIRSLYLTRSEAVKRGVQVTMCKSNNGATCVVDAGATDWSQGWIVFTDLNTNAIFDNAPEVLIKIQSAAYPQITIQSTHAAFRNSVSYSPDGSIPSTAGTIEICDNRRGELVGKNIVLSTAGRARVDSGILCPW